MHTQTLTSNEAQQAQQPNSQPLLSMLPSPIKTALKFMLVCAVVLAIGLASWGMLRAEFDETFHMLSACHTVAPDRMA